MARTITDEEIKLSIIINGNPAQKQLLDLEKATRKLTEENKALNVERRRLEAQGKKDTDQYKALTATIKANSIAIDNNKASMRELQNQIGITSLTIGQLRDKANQLRMTLKNLTPDSADFKKFDAELKQVNARLGELTGKAQSSKLSISSLADGFNKYQALAFSLVATFTGVALSIQKIIDINGKLSDAQADVMKTTGMTKDEVDELTKSFGALETRTSRIDLLKIAEQGGRIGIAKADIQDFVKNMNMANVALGDSFTGGVEEVANKLGKLKFLFQETKDMSVDKSYNAIGSAINDLGANGVASEANITEFATRLGSLPDVLKPTIKEALALGAAFEESGIEAEVSSRAYNIFMKQASTESAKFAQVMGLTKKQVEDMINTNPLDFMMKFAEGMRGMDATETAKTLDFLGVNADGANKVIGAMGNNMNRFRELIDISNDSFSEGTSLINEYNVKNNNLAATLEKISKTVNGWFSSETFIKWLSASVLWIAKFIGATDDADGTVSKWRYTLVNLIKIVSVAVVGFTSYAAALKLIALLENGLTGATTLLTIAQKANALSGGTLKAVYLGLQYVFYTLTLQEDRATAAMIRFNLATKMNPIGLLVGLIMAAVAAYVIFNKEIDKSIVNQKNLNEVKANAQKAVAEEKTALEQLLIIARDKNQSDATREAAIKRINAISPEYLGNISLETINTDKATTAINKYLEALDLKAMKEAFASKRADLSKNVIDARGNEETSIYDAWYNTDKARIDFKKFLEMEVSNIEQFKKKTNGWNAPTVEAYNAYKLSIKQAKEQLKALGDEEKKFIDKNANLYVTPTNTNDSNFTVPGDKGSVTSPKKDPNSTKSELDKLLYEDSLKWAQMNLDLKRRIEDESISILKDGYQKEMQLENLRYIREMQDLESKKVNKEELLKIQAEIDKAEIDGDKTKVAALTTIKENWKNRNEIIQKQIGELESNQVNIHNLKVATIEEKAAKDSINKDKAEFDRKKVLRETAYYNELAALGDNEKAKEKLKKDFQANELIEEEKFLKELIEKFKLITGKESLGNIDLSLLTPEQVLEFQKEAEKVGLTLAQLIEKKNDLLVKENKSELDALGLKSSTDILGFSADNWDTLFSNLEKGKFGINEMVFAVQALTNMYAQYSSFLDANENAQLKKNEQTSNKKKLNLKRQLDAGYINQNQYNKAIEKIDNDLDKQKAETEYKQAKRQKAIAAMNVITSTAQAIIGIWAQFPKFDFGATAAIMSGVVGAMGALQLATVLRTPLPARGFEEGLYPVKREQDGKMFQSRFGGKTKSGLVTKPTYFLTGENGPEMIIDSRAYSQISPAVKNALWNELKGIKGFENGMYNENSKRFEVPAASPSASTSNEELLKMNAMVMAETLEVLKDLRDSGVRAHIQKDDYSTAKGIKEMVDDYNTLRNKNKIK